MARNYGTTATGIWRDGDFRARSAAAQRVYWLLFTQPDITAAGTLALTLRRWASLAPDTTEADVKAALLELSEHRFIVVDGDTEELLVRSFVKWDGGAGNPKRRPSILNAAHAVASERLRAALAVEFERLGLPTEGLSECLSDGHSEGYSGGAQEALSAGGESPKADLEPETLFPQVNSLSDRQSDTHTDTHRVVVQVGTTGEQPTTHNPQPTTLIPQPESAPRSLAPRKRDATWDAVMDACGIDTTAIPSTARGAYNRAVADLRRCGATPDDIAHRARVYRVRWPDASLTPTALARRWAEVADVPPQLARADQRTVRNAQLVQRLRAQEGNHHTPREIAQ